ncbi:hypothetical protein N7537_003527 [Penicillium hordei]|uniref:F-box domain-containing protein n=1 Tax=Penicillium hordei TaxID=40994 RepID=A0AAD6EA71_9EURO|nr:uncharacterized protein N7537_003527 [Penicillium hordei]KAJ5606908.1 hypothetical protein N7537_003527 [Penicillium hordei]
MLTLQDHLLALNLQDTKLSIWGFPSEILFIIFDCLPEVDLVPEVDQVYFALTCKSLYAHFLASLKTKPLYQSLPKHLIPRPCRTFRYRNLDLEKQDRMQLLRRLENPRWKCCIECLHLHPHSAWEKPNDCSDPRLPSGKACMPWAGLVDICPCTRITFKDRFGIAEDLKSADSPRYDGFFSTRVGGCRQLWHRCEVTSHRANVVIQTMLQTNEEAPSLWVINAYTFHFPKGMHQKKMECPTCLLENPRKWLKRFFRDAGVEFVGWDKGQTSTFDVQGTELYLFQLRVHRYLGCRGWVDEDWESNCNEHERILDFGGNTVL